MESHCILCGAKIDNSEQYLKNMTELTERRYRDIIDALVESNLYDSVQFDDARDFPCPYRQIAHRNASALQEERGKGRTLWKKEVDITAVRGDFCDIVIEEELRPSAEDVQRDINLITPCKFLWTHRQLFELQDAYLFIVINDNVRRVPEQNLKGTGRFKRVIVCTTQNFKQLYELHYLPGP